MHALAVATLRRQPCRLPLSCARTDYAGIHVINTLQGINASVKAKHFDSYDFSTLYTSIPHVSLIICMNSLMKPTKPEEPRIWQQIRREYAIGLIHVAPI